MLSLADLSGCYVMMPGLPAAAWRKSSHSGATNCAEVGAWRKSSRSNSGGCAEVGQDGAVVGVRDSQDPDGAMLAVSGDAWTRFLAGIKGDRRPAFPDLE